MGVEFPVHESWRPEIKKIRAEENYKLIRNVCGDYINQINTDVEKAVTSGWTPSRLAQQIMKIDHFILSGRANFIALDQIGKLNGQVTQARMEEAGLSMYIWSTPGRIYSADVRPWLFEMNLPVRWIVMWSRKK